MNDFLIDIHFCHPSLASSLKLLPLFHSLSSFPSLSVRIPSYLSEQGFGFLQGKKASVEKNKRKQIKRAQTGRTVWERTRSQGRVYQGFRFFFPPFPAELFFKVVWSPWLFQSVSVVVVWDGCHHAAGKTGGAAAVPTSENSQAEGNKALISGTDREKTSAKSLRHHGSGFRGYCWRLLLCLCCVMFSPPAVVYFVLFLNEMF